mmetsp:Transcript_108409/g.313244  ORF Transcript_108409/g.313244 Transcript_108409/m.313244 type:complete len:248 (-) Transcript_108409:57-800(-)
MTMNSLLSALVAAALAFPHIVGAFQVQPRTSVPLREKCILFASDMVETGLAISLEKPMGIVLEEVEEGQAMGVYVASLNEDGSAFNSEYKDQLVGLKLVSVMGTAVDQLNFDSVMDTIIEAPNPVNLEFKAMNEEEAESEAEDMYPVGTVVPITVLDGDSERVIEVKVGDNLRKSLLENNFEVYKGLKQKLGNCGGGGQCTFCATDFVSSEGWAERSDYEDSKLKKAPNARLACLNNVQGPATIRLS